MDLTTILILILSVVVALNTLLIFRLVHSNKKVSEMAELIEKANRIVDTKEDVIAVVSHDLKGPLNRIYALINLIELSEGALTKEQMGYMNKMSQVVKEGLVLIKNTLDIRKIEIGDTSINYQEVDIGKLLANLVYDYQQLAKYKVVDFKLEGIKNAQIITDPFYLERVLENLLSNSLKFSPPGAAVEVCLNATSDYFEINIRDNGQGIPLDELPYIFDKYRTLSPQPTAGETSSGIGLAIVKSLCDLMNYEIGFISEPGQGTTAVLKVPNQGRR